MQEEYRIEIFFDGGQTFGTTVPKNEKDKMIECLADRKIEQIILDQTKKKMKHIFLKLLLILIQSIITGVLVSLFEDYRIRVFIMILHGYFSCIILNYKKFKRITRE